MLNTRKRHGWSSSYNESGDALHPCWNSEVSTSASATNGPNDIADDQTIATTASAQTVKYTNVAFPKMQQQQKQPSKKSPPASDGAAVDLLYPSIRDFVNDQFGNKLFKRMLSKDDAVTAAVRATVQGAKGDFFMTDFEIIRQVHEACKSVECLDSEPYESTSLGRDTAPMLLELTRADPVDVPDEVASVVGGSIFLESVASVVVSITGTLSAWNTFRNPPAPTEEAVVASPYEIVLASRSDSASALTEEHPIGLVAHGVGQRRFDDNGNTAMDQASDLNGARVPLLLLRLFLFIVAVSVAVTHNPSPHPHVPSLPTEEVASIDGGSMLLETVASMTVSSTGTVSAWSGSAPTEAVLIASPNEIALAPARSDSWTGELSLGLVTHAGEQCRSADDDDATDQASST